ncbi:hypothetical protein GCM10022237_41920 [Nocardioides ginsengisoli]
MQYAEKSITYTRWTLVAAVLAALFVAVVAAVPPAQSSRPASDSFPVGSFESHLDGFSAVKGSRVSISRTGLGRNNSRAMVLRSTGKGPAATVSKHRFAGSHAAGTKYVVSAWVRTKGARKVGLRVREVAAAKAVQTRTVQVATKPGAWTRVKLAVTTTKRDSSLALRFRTPQITPTDRILVDDLSVVAARKPVAGSPVSGSAGTTGGTVSTPTGTAGTMSNGCTVSARGIPSCGTFVGAAHGSNTDPATLESQLGHKLAVHRTYYTSTGVASAVKMATSDLAAGRLPWISFKLPYNWTDMANGKGDAWVKDLAQKFSALHGPVWLAFHHEPEGDGDIQEWRRMQEHLAPIVRATAPNVGYTVILMGYHEFYGAAQYSLANIWPHTKIDVAGFDIYQQYGVVKNGVTTTKWTDFNAYYQKISTWAKSVGVAWGLGETGVTDKGIVDRPTEIANDVNLMKQYGGIAYSYFDSGLNSVAPWTLGTTAKKNAYAKVLAGSPMLP